MATERESRAPHPRTIFLLFTGAYFLSYFFRAANAVIAGDLARDLALDAGQLGLMTSLYFATFAVAQLPIGFGLDRWGPRMIVPSFLCCTILGTLLFASAQSFGPLALGRALIGLGVAAILPSAFKVFSLWFPPRRVATMSALLVGAGSSGALVAATPLAWLTQQIGWRAVFAGAAVMVAASALAIATRARNTRPSVPWPAATASAGGFRAVIGDGRFWQIAPITFFFAGTQLGVQALWAGPYLFDVAGLSKIAAGNLLLLLSGGVSLGSALSGYCTDRFGVAQTVVASCAIFIVSQFALVSRPPLAALAIVYFLFGLSGSFCIMTMAHSRQLFPPAMTGQAVAITNFFGIGGSFCLQWGMGLIIKQFGADAAGHYPPAAYSAAFLVTAVGTTLGLLWYLPLALRTMRRERQPAASDGQPVTSGN